MSLYNKHRPTQFDDLIGNEETIDSLKNLLAREGRPKAFLFTGPYGCGKTTIAQITARELGCTDMEFKELNTADFKGVDTIRGIRRHMHLKVLEGDCRVWLLDECHKLTNDAQNALLKPLESCPPHVHFMLATTHPQGLNKGILSRCSRFEMTPLTKKEMVGLLKQICREEGKRVPRDVLSQIAKSSQGSSRDAIVLLESVMDLDEDQMLERAKQQVRREASTKDLCRALIESKGWKVVKDILKELKGEEPEQIRRAILGYCGSILLEKENTQAYVVASVFRERPFYSGFPDVVISCYEALMDVEKET